VIKLAIEMFEETSPYQQAKDALELIDWMSMHARYGHDAPRQIMTMVNAMAALILTAIDIPRTLILTKDQLETLVVMRMDHEMLEYVASHQVGNE
jgi:hypothetical protein